MLHFFSYVWDIITKIFLLTLLKFQSPLDFTEERRIAESPKYRTSMRIDEILMAATGLGVIYRLLLLIFGGVDKKRATG